MKYTVRCQNIGCMAALVRIKLETDEFPVNVICGSCETEITDIQEIVIEEPITE